MSHAPVLFDGWSTIGRTLALSVCAYVATVVLLRVSGKRTLAKMNISDFVFVVAIGSTVANTILSATITLAAGVTALACLIGLQVGTSKLTIHSRRFELLMNGQPVLLYANGTYLEDAMRRERVTAEEIRAAARASGLPDLAAADAVVLETDGTFAVLRRAQLIEQSTLVDVVGPPPAAGSPERARRAESSVPNRRRS